MTRSTTTIFPAGYTRTADGTVTAPKAYEVAEETEGAGEDDDRPAPTRVIETTGIELDSSAEPSRPGLAKCRQTPALRVVRSA